SSIAPRSTKHWRTTRYASDASAAPRSKWCRWPAGAPPDSRGYAQAAHHHGRRAAGHPVAGAVLAFAGSFRSRDAGADRRRRVRVKSSEWTGPGRLHVSGSCLPRVVRDLLIRGPARTAAVHALNNWQWPVSADRYVITAR